MKTAIITDIHANLEALRAVLDHARDQGADEYVCLGDVVGYNADPGPCVDEIRRIPGLRCLLGNHDAMAVGSGPLTGINILAHAAMTWTRAHLDDEQKAWLSGLPLTCEDADAQYSHASLEDPAAWRYVNTALDAARHLAYQHARVGFVGHSHVMFAWHDDGDRLDRTTDTEIRLDGDGRWLVSVGSVGQPRDDNPRAGYAMFDHAARTVIQHRIPYDIAEAQRKILAAGLPPELAHRLG
ncbi:metallophosphatase family protein [bacterium]|nr:metallophosphatase family protein [bacterium]MBU1073206.1 metallophosphatase family protein [bacterium]MBU1674713.1 metallophosphatase family protein [bacterium]